MNTTEKLKFVLEMVENIFGKEENAVYQHFLLFSNVFKSHILQGRLMSELCGKELRTLPKRGFGNIVGKAESASSFFSFCTMVSMLYRENSIV